MTEASVLQQIYEQVWIFIPTLCVMLVVNNVMISVIDMAGEMAQDSSVITHDESLEYRAQLAARKTTH